MSCNFKHRNGYLTITKYNQTFVFRENIIAV